MHGMVQSEKGDSLKTEEVYAYYSETFYLYFDLHILFIEPDDEFAADCSTCFMIKEGSYIVCGDYRPVFGSPLD